MQCKLAYCYDGPWKVVKISCDKTHCTIALCDNETITHHYHFNLLKRVENENFDIRQKFTVGMVVSVRSGVVCKFSELPFCLRQSDIS